MSGLNLINEDERLTYRGEGYDIFYRRISNARRGQIYERCKKTGRDVDFTKATIQMLEYSVLGWNGVFTQDENGKRTEVPFDTSKVSMIPDAVQAELVELIGANADQGEVEAKNLPNTSDSSETTPA